MLRSELGELLIHGLQPHGIKLRFETKMPYPVLKLEDFELAMASRAAKKCVVWVAGVFVGEEPIDAFCLSDLWYSSTFHRLW